MLLERDDAGEGRRLRPLVRWAIVGLAVIGVTVVLAVRRLA